MTNAESPPLSASIEKGFSAALRSFHLRCCTARLLAGLLRAVLFAAGSLLIFGLLDYYGSFGDPARLVVFRLLGFVFMVGTVAALWRTVAFGRRDAAIEADRKLGSPRRAVLSAWELRHEQGSSGPSALGKWLHQRALAVARDHVQTFRWSHALPRQALADVIKATGCLLCIFIALAIVAPEPVAIVTKRLLFPERDIPPYSPLRFALGPQPADVLYGADIVVSADITGGKVAGPVRCLTRDPATHKIAESPAFQESPTRYSRKLEKVAASVDVAFAVGQARSAWLPVTALLQPKVQDVILTVEPPAYSKLPGREFAVGTQELAPLPGSRITASLSSNRPTGSGTLRIEAADQGGAKQEIAGEPFDTHRVRFTWVAREPARLAFQVKDILGTASPLMQIEQKITPDERPRVTLRQPAGDVLATPEIEIPFEATAQDDLGLTKFTVVRQLQGFRERSTTQQVSPGERRFDMTGALKLASYGVVPGQTIELSLEAGDTNPNLLGVSVSEPARIHIIARDQYAQLLRDQVTLEDFTGRYEALRDALEKARDALRDLEKEAQSGYATRTEEARKKAEGAHRKAGQIFGQLAKDFPLFDLDEALSTAAAAGMKELFENAKQLDELRNEPPASVLDAVPQLKERLGATEQELASGMKQGERATAAASIFEHAGKFRELLDAQRQLTKDYNRVLEQIRRGETQANQALKDLAREQRDISDGLRKLENELEGSLNGLPDEFAKLREEGQQFVRGLRDLEVEPTMDEGAVAAEQGDGRTAGARADEARARLEALLRRKNAICAMCRGEGDQGFPWPEDLASTLRQLMRSLIARRGGKSGEGDDPGDGTGGAGGFGGLSDSGFSMRGKMPRLPIYGPSRLRFGQRAGPQVGSGEHAGNASGNGRPEEGADVGETKLSSKSHDKAAGEGLALDSVPEAYREALKRYFSSDEPASAPSVPGARPPTP